MDDFIPSERFVAKTMEAIASCEARKVRPAGEFARGIAAAVLQRGALLVGFGIVVVNVLRMYYAVFAPVLSH